LFRRELFGSDLFLSHLFLSHLALTSAPDHDSISPVILAAQGNAAGVNVKIRRLSIQAAEFI